MREIILNKKNNFIKKYTFFHFCFQNFSTNLYNVRLCIKQNGFDESLIQIFEYICIIHGYICSTVHPLRKQINRFDEYVQLINSSEIIELYSTSLNNVSHICQSIETLIRLNTNKFNHISQFATMVNLFSQFYEDLKVLNFRHIFLRNSL